MTRREHLIMTITALLVAAIELGATLGSLNGEPMDLVNGWAPTRPGDMWAVLLTATGCAALFIVRWFPVSALAASSGAYAAFIIRDYEFGMTLPSMVTLFILTACGRHRLLAVGAATVCLSATLVWIAQRTTAIADEGTTVLVWVAFGAVSFVFFLLPILLGEIARLRRAARVRALPAGLDIGPA